MSSNAMGVIAGLWRYPVKSMLGERASALHLDQRGAVGDRLHAIRDAQGKFGSGKNTRRFRRIDGLLRFSAAYDGEVPVITFPDGSIRRGDDPAIHAALSEHLGLPVTLARESAISHLDAGPLHLLTTASMRTLAGALPGTVLDARRFRPNLVVETDGTGFPEDAWLGRELSVGDEVRLRITSRAERCVMVGLPQAELPDDSGVLRELGRMNEARIGVYAEVITPGTIRIGDLLG